MDIFCVLVFCCFLCSSYIPGNFVHGQKWKTKHEVTYQSNQQIYFGLDVDHISSWPQQTYGREWQAKSDSHLNSQNNAVTALSGVIQIRKLFMVHSHISTISEPSQKGWHGLPWALWGMFIYCSWDLTYMLPPMANTRKASETINVLNFII